MGSWRRKGLALTGFVGGDRVVVGVGGLAGDSRGVRQARGGGRVMMGLARVCGASKGRGDGGGLGERRGGGIEGGRGRILGRLGIGQRARRVGRGRRLGEPVEVSRPTMMGMGMVVVLGGRLRGAVELGAESISYGTRFGGMDEVDQSPEGTVDRAVGSQQVLLGSQESIVG